MSWNYRIFKDKNGFSIREVFYEEGEVALYSSEESAPFGETRDELHDELTNMEGAFLQTTLTKEDFKK